MLENAPNEITIYEVGPRDGLQNESRRVPTADKIAFIDALSATGLPYIEITSFVSPKWIPQLSDAAEVARGVKKRDGVVFSALVPNMRGLDNAIDAGMGEVAVFLSASETHNKKNTNKTIAESLSTFEAVVTKALDNGLRVRAYVSTVFGCPYEGQVAPEAVVRVTTSLRELGVYQVSLGDTIGVANPKQVDHVIGMLQSQVASNDIDRGLLAVHFHDTQGTALANCVVAMAHGVTTIDSSVGGLGGCPYAPGASGNLATEDLVAMAQGMGVECHVDLEKLVGVSQLAAAFVGHELPSKYLKAHLGKSARAPRSQDRDANAQAKSNDDGTPGVSRSTPHRGEK